MSRPLCTGTRKDGRPCRAPALASGWCWAHDPDHREQAQQARLAGASKGGKLRALHGRRKRLDSPRAIVGFVSNLVHDLVEGRQDAEIVRTVAYTLSVQIRALELAESSDGRQLVAEVERLARQARQAR